MTAHLRFGVLAVMLLAWAGPVRADDWGALVTVSNSLGINDGRVCVGEGSRGDIGCPAYAPVVDTMGLTVSGTVTTNRVVGDDGLLGRLVVGGPSLPSWLSSMNGNLVSINSGHVFHTGGSIAHYFNTYWDTVGNTARFGGYGGGAKYGAGFSFDPANGVLMFEITSATGAGGDVAPLRDVMYLVNTATGADLTVNGDITSANYFMASDRRLKENIVTSGGLAVIAKLRGVTFDWKKDGSASGGVIAQEIETVIPAAVKTDAHGMKAVNYDQLIAPLIEAVKELQRDVEALKAENRTLREELNAK